MTERTLVLPARLAGVGVAGLFFAHAALWLATVIAYQRAVGAANTSLRRRSAVFAVVYPAPGR